MASSAAAAKPLSGTPGALLQLVREGAASTRAQLAALTGLARSTVSQRVDALLAAGYLQESGEAPSTGGRPPTRLVFNPGVGVVLAADLGATHSRLAVCDLAYQSLAEATGDIAIAQGPDTVLGWAVETFERLLAEVGRPQEDIRAIGIGLPGPVEHATGRAVNPPIMPGWDGVRVPDIIGPALGAPVFVDNDVNIMAIGEYRAKYRDDVDDLLFVKVGTGIGAGIVSSGRIQRGAQGAAGDLGHVRVPGHDVVCRCGNVGCVEAVVGGAALARRLRDAGHDATVSRDVVALVNAGNIDAIRLVREGGRLLGETLAAAVNLLNPAVIVIGGDVAAAHEHLLAGVREAIYQRSLPLATRHLRIVRSLLEDRAGITGAAVMASETILAPEAVDRELLTGPRGRALA